MTLPYVLMWLLSQVGEVSEGRFGTVAVKWAGWFDRGFALRCRRWIRWHGQDPHQVSSLQVNRTVAGAVDTLVPWTSNTWPTLRTCAGRGIWSIGSMRVRSTCRPWLATR